MEMVFTDLLIIRVHLHLGHVLFFYITKHFYNLQCQLIPIIIFDIATMQGMYWLFSPITDEEIEAQRGKV